MLQLNSKQIAELKRYLSDYGLDVRPKPKPRKPNDWISERERVIRSLSMKSQSAFFKSTQLKLLALRRKISPEYEAFIRGESK